MAKLFSDMNSSEIAFLMMTAVGKAHGFTSTSRCREIIRRSYFDILPILGMEAAMIKCYGKKETGEGIIKMLAEIE